MSLHRLIFRLLYALFHVLVTSTFWMIKAMYQLMANSKIFVGDGQACAPGAASAKPGSAVPP
jgi:hypothetical protein